MHQAHEEAPGPFDIKIVVKVVKVMLKMVTVTPAMAKPSSSEAQRILGFFMSSLSNRQLGKPPPLVSLSTGGPIEFRIMWTLSFILYPLSSINTCCDFPPALS